MEFGVQVNVYRMSAPQVRASAEAMEAGGWDSIWFADHFIPPGGVREEEALTAFEGLSTIAFVAGMTKRLRLGNLVLGNTYRNPRTGGQGRRHHRHPERRTLHPRHRRGLVPARTRGVRLDIPFDEGAPRSLRGSLRTHPAADPVKRPGQFQRQVLSTRRGASGAGFLRRADPHHGRRDGSETHVAYAREVR